MMFLQSNFFSITVMVCNNATQPSIAKKKSYFFGLSGIARNSNTWTRVFSLKLCNEPAYYSWSRIMTRELKIAKLASRTNKKKKKY